MVVLRARARGPWSISSILSRHCRRYLKRQKCFLFPKSSLAFFVRPINYCLLKKSCFTVYINCKEHIYFMYKEEKHRQLNWQTIFPLCTILCSLKKLAWILKIFYNQVLLLCMQKKKSREEKLGICKNFVSTVN